MDEEDMAELRESRKLVDEHEEMDFGGTAAEKRKLQAGAADQECVFQLSCLLPVPQLYFLAQYLPR